MKKPDSIAVVHLVWLKFDLALFSRFINSYKLYMPSIDHELIILFNGLTSTAEMTPYLAIAHDCGITFRYFTLEKGQDITAYYYAAGKLSHKYVLFLNSYSRILSEGWLDKFLAAIRRPGVGAVAATGSFQSYYSSVFTDNSFLYDFKKNLRENFRKYKLFLKAFFYWRFLFRPFPNIHLRTNAFIIEREVFLQLHTGKLNSKFAAYRFESGHSGLTAQLMRKKLSVLIAGRNGLVYEPRDWPRSNTFRSGDQENLLVEDNQTSVYAGADEQGKIKLKKATWGKYAE